MNPPPKLSGKRAATTVPAAARLSVAAAAFRDRRPLPAAFCRAGNEVGAHNVEMMQAFRERPWPIVRRRPACAIRLSAMPSSRDRSVATSRSDRKPFMYTCQPSWAGGDAHETALAAQIAKPPRASKNAKFLFQTSYRTNPWRGCMAPWRQRLIQTQSAGTRACAAECRLIDMGAACIRGEFAPRHRHVRRSGEGRFLAFGDLSRCRLCITGGPSVGAGETGSLGRQRRCSDFE